MTEAEDWRECAKYDALMDGPRFKGWNRSALDRCRKKYIENATEEPVRSKAPRQNDPANEGNQNLPREVPPWEDVQKDESENAGC